MAKRIATSDLNHENWDQEEPPEVAGTFQKASNDVMQRRIVRTAKRRTPTVTEGSGAGGKSVFSGFDGFKTAGSAMKSGSELKSTFSFLSGGGNAPVTNGFQSTTTSKPSSTTSASSPVFTSSVKSVETDKSKKYPARLIRLNQQIADWIKQHVDKDPSCILTPIFRDYERYLKEIEEESDKEGSINSDGTKQNFSIPPSLSSPSSPGRQQQGATTKGTSASPDSVKPSASSSHSIFSSFKADNIKPAMSFLSKPDPSAMKVNPFLSTLMKGNEDKKESGEPTKTAEFSFGSSGQQSTSSSGFSFTSGKILSFGNVPNPLASSSSSKQDEEKEGEDEEDSDEPPKVESTPVVESDSVYTKRCKVFIKKTEGYADLGVGTLFVKEVAGGKHQLVVRADTSLGNILVNVLLASAIPTQRMGKNNVMMICVPVPPVVQTDTPATPSTVLLRVKTAEEADDLLANLEKYKN